MTEAESSTPLARTCATCEHCDTSEARNVRNIYDLRVAGYCTRSGGHFNAKPVPVWLTGCPDYERQEEDDHA